MPLRRLPLVILIALTVAAQAAPVVQPLDPARPERPAIQATVVEETPGGLVLRVEVGALAHETVAGGGRTWQALTLPDCSVEGEIGRPGVPVWTGLVVVPAGATAVTTAIASDQRVLGDLDLLPVQPDGATEFTIDAGWYGKAAPTGAELVSVGAPASLGGVTVAPIVVRPVSYDAAARRATVAGTVEIDLRWQVSKAAAPSRPVSPSMLRLVAAAAINGDAAARIGETAVNDVPGTWLAICPNLSTVSPSLQPLVDWRRRQGYHVVVADLTQTGTTNSAIKNWLVNQYQTLEPQLEYVVFVGDANGSVAVPTWNETVSGLSGEGDHYYTQLADNDILPDVQVGRLSCASLAELQTIVAKIVAYETDPPRQNPAWFTRGLAVGDPSSSGITTIYCAQWLRAQLDAVGYTHVDTVFGGNFTASMISYLNQGCSVFGYRGFAGMSGFTAGHAAVLSNGGAQTFALFPTCNTGNFKSESSCRTEAFLRNANGGAIGAIATATGGTHTRYNNCFFQGVWEGLINGSDHRTGPALTRGKLELFRNYALTELHTVERFSVWNNLMGDPATDVWMAEPADLVVSHPAQLPPAAGALPVTITRDGAPLAGLRVAAVQGTSVRVVGLTDQTGQITLPLPVLDAGSLLVTASGHNLLPYRGEITVGDQATWVSLESWTLDDAGGDGDGVANPGEPLAIDLVLHNLGSGPASGLVATVTSESPWIAVVQPEATFPPIGAGRTEAGDQPVVVAVAADAPDQQPCRLRIAVDGDSGAWVSQLTLTTIGSRLEVVGTEFSAGDPLPGATGTLAVTLANLGHRACAGATAVLTSRSPWIAITDSLGAWNALPIDGQAANTGDPFGVTFTDDCVRGHLAPLTLRVTETDGARRRVDFVIAVGAVGDGDPAGPDAYGYYAFDSGDTGYGDARPYEWIEIDPSRGGFGTDVGLSDFGYEQDDTEVVALPFVFRYYGREYSSIAVCSNGWIAPGATTFRDYRNWTIPSAGSPDAMIAAFWDDLYQNGANRVFRWYDSAGHRFIVEWSRVRNDSGSEQTFEVILEDPAHHPTASGDGTIVVQYHTVANNDYARNYATAGIQNPTGTDGVLYTYSNLYAPGAATLAAGLAVTYVPAGFVSDATCEVDPLDLTFTVPPGGQQSRTLHIANNGVPGTTLLYAISQTDPTVPAEPDKSLTGSWLAVQESGYIPGEPITLHVSVHNGSPDWEWILNATLALPPGVDLLGGTDLLDDYGDLVWQNHSGDGADAFWQGSSYDLIHEGRTAVGTVTIVVDVGVGDLTLPWILQGDQYGSPPHTLTGEISLACLVETVDLLAPDGGERWSEGESRQIVWHATPDIDSVTVEVSHDAGANWQTIAAAVPASQGHHDWIVTGPVSGACLARVTDRVNLEATDQSDGYFTIQHDLSWLELDAWSGEVQAGSAVTLTAIASAAGLADGVYQQLLIISHNAGPALTVPVLFLVGSVTPVGDLPAAVTLAQNRPNPFNPLTRIDFALPAAGPVELAIYDLTGRRVAVLVEGEQPAGDHSVVWPGRDERGRALPSGTYVYRLLANGEVLSRKLTLVK
ncbi:MAG TPA: C25 family cysteine peptidase [Candidatus Krumholzibacteria bacterium]|nr:C25 family cysteine peptidase [Candidatus Krumholzibacteria bacterium]HPD70888.1 C25 family cysteine peptidase [Candidatus Krumholzibacteria bacterium]HRY39412.1 C25 family cysteine peptidase [Candidatus Krumholzibacteria bacterium]